MVNLIVTCCSKAIVTLMTLAVRLTKWPAIAALSCACSQSMAAEGPAKPDGSQDGQWLAYGRDDAQQRFSPLTAINAANVRHLGLAFKVILPAETSLVSTPLMAGGTLYFTGRFSVVYAVDARTGAIRWTFDPKAREELVKTPRRMTYNWGVSRGLAYWKGTLLVATADGRLISLSEKDGSQRWSASTIDPSEPYLYITGAPMVFRDRVLIGNGGGDFGPSRGYVTAYSASTGTKLWRTFTVPGDPAKGVEGKAMAIAAKTWGPEWWKTTGGGNVWNAMTFDAEFNRIYIGTGNGSPWNHNIRGRAGGDNLYVASIIALDAESGQYIWHYQVVPGDNWDYDATQDLVLADLELRGTKTKVLMQANKDGFYYVIDRSNGRLISAEKYAHVTWADRVDLSTGRPVEAPGMRPLSGVITFWPWVNGAHSWPSMSFSPDTGLTYIPGMDVRQVLDVRGIDPKTYKAGPVDQWMGYSDIIGRGVGRGGDTFEPSAWLKAFDPKTGKTAWQVKQPGLWSGGTLTTHGNLIFIGQANGDLAAYNAETGVKLWAFACGRPITAAPISYALNGTQYVAVLAGWGGSPAVEGALSEPGGLRMTYRDGGRGLYVFALNGTASTQLPPVAKVVPIDVPTFQPDEKLVRVGEHLFDNTCNLCHGTDALSGGAAPDLRASPLAADRTTLGNIVLKGLLQVRGMPQYVDFADRDVDALYHYIRWRARRDLRCMNEDSAASDQCADVFH
jgi:quinohemoprotein ethanol dehydrogenase